MPIGTGLVRSDWIGLILGELIGRMLGIVRLWRVAAPVVATARVEPAPTTPLWRKYWKYPGVLLPSSLIDALAQNLGVPLVAALFGLIPAGQYALIHRLAQAPAALIGTSAADVLHRQLSSAEVRLRRGLVLRLAAKLAGVSVVIYGVAAVAAHWLTEPVLGRQWADAGRMFVILVPAYCALFTVSPLSRALLLTKRMQLKFVADLAALLLPLAAMALFKAGGIWIALGAFMVANVVAALVYLVLILYAMRDDDLVAVS
jgi:O-antigen/teichoic acid export membrane protein